MHKFVKLGALAAVLAAAAPAAAQYQEPRRGRVADEIARTAAEAAEAVVAVTEAVRGAADTVRYRSPAERFAAERCTARAERYGRVRIDRVRPYRNRSWQVFGIADPAGYDRYRYDSRRYRPRSFECRVRDDGEITRFKTRRLRYR